MRHPKLVAALAALTLTVGGLALAGPALAQEVPSSPDIASTSDPTPSTSPISTPPDGGAPESTPTTPTPEVATPGVEVSVDPTPPTEPTPSTDSTEKPSSSTATTSSIPTTEESAESSTTSTSPASVEGWWLLPNGGTADNVTWPQAVTEADTVPCGVTAQVDTYPSAEVLATLQADGQLDQGEDYSTVISWRFVVGPKCGPVTITVPTLTVTPPTCDVDGALPFLGNPAAQNPNGYEFPGEGFRVYLDRAFDGPGVYVATIQKVGPGFDPAFPYGTKVTGETRQTLTVEVATGDQSTDPEGACYVAPPVVEPPVVVPPVVTPPTVTPTPEVTTPTEARTIAAQEVASEKLAATGSDDSGKAVVLLAGLAVLILGIIMAVVFGRRVPKQK